MNHRDKQILCGLFLSKFDQDALAYLGFATFTEAFNILGYGLGALPASIKNYRDELDPYFPNDRKGWHKRPLRPHCQQVLNRYKDSDIKTIGDLIQSFLDPALEIESLPAVKKTLENRVIDAESSFAKRLMTGKAAEQYFAAHFGSIDDFQGFKITDTTSWGCGFDFKLDTGTDSSFKAVEVKGLRSKFGQIHITELEYEMAEALNGAYYLVIVRNFVEQPFLTVIKNPLESHLALTKTERQEVRVSWIARISE